MGIIHVEKYTFGCAGLKFRWKKEYPTTQTKHANDGRNWVDDTNLGYNEERLECLTLITKPEDEHGTRVWNLTSDLGSIVARVAPQGPTILTDGQSKTFLTHLSPITLVRISRVCDKNNDE